MTKILVVDDHAVVREGLKQLLAETFPRVDFRASATLEETQELIQAESWDLVVLDLFMPGGDSLGVLRDARQRDPRIPVLVLSSASEEQLGLRVLRAGASGYVDKQTAPEHLVQAVHRILEGGKYISPNLAEKLVTRAESGDKPLHEKLSDREFEVLYQIVLGRSLKEIAWSLSLSVKTVRTFRSRLLRKLDLHSDVGLVHYALEHGLVEKNVIPRPPD